MNHFSITGDSKQKESVAKNDRSTTIPGGSEGSLINWSLPLKHYFYVVPENYVDRALVVALLSPGNIVIH